MRALQRAKTALQKANRDFGGHRAKAIDLANQAIEEVQAAMQADTQCAGRQTPVNDGD